MALLAIDTATPTLALAVADHSGQVLASWSTKTPKIHATYVNQLLDDMLATVSCDPRDIEGVIVGVGPGSYTGIRIGVTAAKIYAFARGVPLVGLSSLTAAAYALAMQRGMVVVMWDARRQSVYGAAYRAHDGALTCVLSEQRYDIASLITAVSNMLHQGEAVYLLGDVVEGVAQQYATVFADHSVMIYDRTASVHGEHLLALGYPELHKKMLSLEVSDHGKDAHGLVPRYLQLAEAEARWLEKRRGSSSNESE
ncbi:MAG: tRNA (adenosine(37)-N6)-threonylcarbamoyltransferase complex dimerization subunit type 1 TsaB [Acidibacillus sp.]|nr:tRNA (adenosine(37)-N6)-threonylcarbamoyltransferase complex dimerization subunit type 1 TsaB [Acidibacillus sp.]